MNKEMMKTVIIGLGNPFLRDDGVGNRVAEMLKKRLAEHPTIDVLELSAGGLRLMEALVGYHRSIIIDAMRTGRYRPGTVRKLAPDDLEMSLHSSSTHDTSLARALASGRHLGLVLPRQIVFWGIEARECHTFGEMLSPEVARAVPVTVAAVLEDLDMEKGMAD
jgi:hydrogenase maturation protease